MGSVTIFSGPRTLTFADEPDRPLQAGEVRLRTLFSGISAGTELTAYRGTNPYLHKRWDSDRRLFVSDDCETPQYPLTGWGYEECGEIIEVGPDGDKVTVSMAHNVGVCTTPLRVYHCDARCALFFCSKSVPQFSGSGFLVLGS